jgi:hypothetical protein
MFILDSWEFGYYDPREHYILVACAVLIVFFLIVCAVAGDYMAEVGRAKAAKAEEELKRAEYQRRFQEAIRRDDADDSSMILRRHDWDYGPPGTGINAFPGTPKRKRDQK